MLNQNGRVPAMRRRGNQPRFSPRVGKPNLSIVSANRKTEICRNWQRGCCIYGAPKCAFAHGAHDLRHQSLDEMEISGRIPNASKFRCYPCLTWVATGACPYFSRCVFIHDPRIRGSKDAWLYSNSQHKGGKGGSVGSPFGRDTFYWPDMPRPITDDKKLPSTTTNYELDPILLTSEDPTDRAVYHLWYSLVGSLLEENHARTAKESGVAGASLCSTIAPASTVGIAPINPKLKGGQQVAPALATGRPPSNRSWVSKNPECRLPVFKRMSRGQPVAPDYVPVPGSLGPLFRCDECGLGSVLHHRGGPQPRTMRSTISLRSHLPLSDISSSSVQGHTSLANKRIRKQKQSWRPEITGIENERPQSERLVVRSDVLPRRSTSQNLLGRVTGTTSRPLGSEIARGLFCGEASNRENVSLVEDQVHDTGFGFQGGNKRDDCARPRSSQSAPPTTSLTIPFPEVADSASRQHFPTPSTASPSTTPSPLAPFASLYQTLSSSPPVARIFDWSDGGSNEISSETLYPFGAFAGGV